MISRNRSGSLVEYLHRKADRLETPFSATFELTPICNMSCNMCYVRRTSEEIKSTGRRLRTVEEWLSLAEQMKEQGTLLLLLTGGEPFTYPGFRELYTALRKMGFVISINTNATLIDKETVEWIAENPPHKMNITLYGASDDTYERLCHNPTGYSKAKMAIEMLQDRGINLKLNCSVTPDNVKDLERIIEYSDTRKLILEATAYMFPPLRRDADSVGKNKRFTPKECARTEAKIRYLQHGWTDLKNYCDAVEKNRPLKDNAFLECEGDGVRCRAGKSSCWITWDGRLLMCAMMDAPYGDPFADGFQPAWEQLKRKAKEIRLPKECAVCKGKDICHICAAMVYTETGTYDKKPQYRCDLLEAIPGACRELLKENKINGNE